MKINLTTTIAKSLLLARWKQTLVAAIGVTFSITMFITLLGFMNGLNELLDGLVVNRTPHIRLYNEIKPSKKQPIEQLKTSDIQHHFIHSIKPNLGRPNIYNSLAIIEALKHKKEILGVAPKVTAQVFYNVGAVDITGVINGIDPEVEKKLFVFDDYIPAGNAMDIKNVPNSIILGIGAAEKMMVNIGDNVQVTTSKGERVSLKIVGFFQSGIQEIDKVQSYCSIATTQKLLGVDNNYITDIQIKLHDIKQAPLLAKKYSELFEIDALDIQTANAQFETGSSVRTTISFAVGITLLIVAGFGIYNILNMMIYEKMDSIAILKATGFSGQDVRNVFLTIALSIGFFGGIF